MASKKSLEAAAATAGLFKQADTETKKPRQQAQTKKQTRQQANAPEPKRETATFSVKIEVNTLKRWRYYAEANGYGDKGKLTEAAISEYMNRHKLTPEQQAKIDRLMEL